MLTARTATEPSADALVFNPRVIDGALAAVDLEGLMAVAAIFEGYEDAAIADSFAASPSIWDACFEITVVGS